MEYKIDDKVKSSGLLERSEKKKNRRRRTRKRKVILYNNIYGENFLQKNNTFE